MGRCEKCKREIKKEEPTFSALNTVMCFDCAKKNGFPHLTEEDRQKMTFKESK